MARDGESVLPYYNIKGVSTFVNPMLTDGVLIHAVNVNSFPLGAKTKRTGYSTFLNNPAGTTVQSLFAFPNIGGTAGNMNLMMASGSQLWYSIGGTGNWQACGNGTITPGGHFGQAIMQNVLIGGDGVTASRHSTDGSTFTDTTLAPVAEFWETFQGRVYAGRNQTEFYSTTNDGTNWNTSGTSDSNSFQIPGPGNVGRAFSCNNQLVITKDSGLMKKWDGYQLIDMATKYGPSSPYSIGNAEDYRFFINNFGHYGYGGAQPQLLSNAIQRQFYNDNSTGIAGTAFSTIPGEVHRYDYFASVGTITDDFTGRVIPNAIIKYDYQKNEYLNWSLANKPTAFLSYKDANGAQQFIFGDATGQVYKFDNSTSDNGTAIASEMVIFFYGSTPYLQDKWNWFRASFNPGCECKVQVACTQVFSYSNLNWVDIGDVSSGYVEKRFPPGSRSSYLFVRIYESSKTARFSYYGCSISCTTQTVDP